MNFVLLLVTIAFLLSSAVGVGLVVWHRIISSREPSSLRVATCSGIFALSAVFALEMGLIKAVQSGALPIARALQEPAIAIALMLLCILAGAYWAAHVIEKDRSRRG